MCRYPATLKIYVRAKSGRNFALRLSCGETACRVPIKNKNTKQKKPLYQLKNPAFTMVLFILICLFYSFPIISLITSPATIRPATEGTKETLPGVLFLPDSPPSERGVNAGSFE